MRRGDGLFTLDSTTSLAWLDLTATVGQSRPTVLSDPFVAEGFRYATQAEVLRLWGDAGATGPFDNEVGSNYRAQNFDAANLLINLMGCTSQVLGELCDGLDQNWNIAFFGTVPTDAAIVDAFGPPDPRNGTAAMWIDFGPTVDILNRPDVGSYLVRAMPTPEPATFAMFGAGLAGAAAMRRLRKVVEAGRPKRLTGVW